MKERDLIEALKPRLTDEFLATLTEAVRVCSWDVDHEESTRFAAWCYGLAGKPCPNLNSVEVKRALPSKEDLEWAIAAMARHANNLEAEHDDPSSESYDEFAIWKEYTALRSVAGWLKSFV